MEKNNCSEHVSFEDIPAEKKAVRMEIRKQRADLQNIEKNRMDHAIFTQVMELCRKRKKQNAAFAVYSYVSFGNEADTRRLIEELCKEEIIVAVPRVEGKQIRFYRIWGMHDLEPGFRGILEPKADCLPAAYKTSLLLMPGAAFTKNGQRLGYGGGFYDRFLTAEPEHEKVALAYAFQMRDALPAEAHDRLIDRIITEAGPIDCHAF